MKKKIIPIGILGGLALIFLVARPLISPTLTPQPSWKEFVNQKYGYQLSYPADWEIEEWDIQEAANLKRVPDGSIWHQAKFFGQEGQFEILIWENRSQTSVRNWLTWFRHEDLILKEVPQEENFMINELPAIRFVQKETAKNTPLLYIFFGQKDRVYELIMTRDDLIRVATPSGEHFNHPGYDQMVESFKFVVE